MSELSIESRRDKLMRILRENGAESLDSQELIELLILFSSRRNDTEAVSFRLFDYFGSFSEILEASVMELTRIEGVSRNTALLFSSVPQIACRVYVDRIKRLNISDEDMAKSFISECFIGKTVEHFLLVCLDRNKRMIRHDFISKGTVNSSSVDLRKIVHIVIASGVSFALVAHNHPRGNIYPSKDDLKTTKVIANALKNIGVELLDHLIVNAKGYYSMAEDNGEVRQYLIPD